MILQVSPVTYWDASNQQCQDDLASFSHQPVWSSRSQYHGGNWMVCPVQHAPWTCFQVWGWVWGGSPIFTIQVLGVHWLHHNLYCAKESTPGFHPGDQATSQSCQYIQMHQRRHANLPTFRQLWHHIVIPWLYVVSTMGTTFATYKLDKPSKCVTPAEILSTNEDMIQDLAPQSWWKHEILEPAGEAIYLRLLRMSKKCLSTSEYHIQFCLHIPLSPLTHSKSFTQTWFQMGGLVPCTISQPPEH